MDAIHLLGLLAGVTLAGCAATGGGAGEGAPQGAHATANSAGAKVVVAPQRTTTLSGQVVSSDGAPLDAVEVLRVPADAYLVPILRTQTDALGAFTLDGVEANALDWFYIDRTGYVSLFQAFDTTADARQALPTVAMRSDAEGDALAQSFGVTLDPGKSVVFVPVTVRAGGQTRPAVAVELEVSLQPPLDVPVHYVDGNAIALNVIAYDSYQVLVRRNGHACVPASHSTLVAADGSVEVRPMSGIWSIGPDMACE
jgi:hypothetical protein